MLIDNSTGNVLPEHKPGSAFKVANIHGGTARHELSRQWIARPHDQRFLSLAELHAHTKARAALASEFTLENRKFSLDAPEATDRNSLQELSISFAGNNLAMSHWAFNQLCGLTKSPSGFLRELPSQLTSDTLNYRLGTRRAEEIKAYATADQLLALTGPDYGRIYDHEVVQAVMEFTGTSSHQWKIPGIMDWNSMVYDPHAPVTKDSTTLFASDRDVFMFMVDDLNPIEVGRTKDGEPDLMFRGFYVTNSEVGASALKLAAFYLRSVCCNRIMWGVEGFEEMTIRHTRFAPQRFMEMARPALNSFANGSSLKLQEGVQKAKAAKVAKDDDSAIEFLQSRKFSKAKALEIMAAVEEEEGRKARSAWDMAQGITALARSIPYNDERVTLETEARRILDKVAA